tara:strand:- start:2864 stop:3661 length:798 start_codon:yes stop_codon:yes gene_type:complete
MAFKLRSGNNTSFKAMGSSSPTFLKKHASPFYKDKDDKEKDKPEKPDKPEKAENREKVEKVKDEKVENVEASDTKEELPIGVGLPQEEVAVEGPQLPPEVDSEKEIDTDAAAQKEIDDQKAQKEIDDQIAKEDLEHLVEDTKEAGKHLAKNATKVVGANKVGTVIERTANLQSDLQNKALDTLSKIKNVNPNSTLGKVAKFGKNVARFGKYGLRFAPIVGQAMLAYDAIKLGHKMYKDRDKIASYLKNKTNNISNSLEEFGDNVT